MEETACEQYIGFQQQRGHRNLQTVKMGLVISLDNPWLAAPKPSS